MNIAIIGYGNMGQRIETLAKQRGHNIVAIIDPRNKKATYTTVSEKSILKLPFKFQLNHCFIILYLSLCSPKPSLMPGTNLKK